MKVSEHLSPKQIHLDVALSDKSAVLRFISQAFAKENLAGDAERVYEALKTREDLMSTGIGGGIGLPHVLTPEVKNVAIVLIRLKAGIPFQAIDHRPVDIVIGLAVPEAETGLHLQVLAGLSGLLKAPGVLKTIRSAADPDLLWRHLVAAEAGMPER